MVAGEQRCHQRVCAGHAADRVVIEPAYADRLALHHAVEDDLGGIQPDPLQYFGCARAECRILFREVHERFDGAPGDGTPHLDAKQAPAHRGYLRRQADERERGGEHRVPGQAPRTPAERLVQALDLGTLPVDEVQAALAAGPAVGAPAALDADMAGAAGPAALLPPPPLRRTPFYWRV